MKIINILTNKYRRHNILKSFCSVGSNLTIFGNPSFVNPQKIIIGNNVNINDGVIINATCSEIQIGDMVTISSNAMILAASYDVDHFLYKDSANEKRNHKYSKVVIGNNVWICAGAIILPNVSIADYVVVGAGSVVTHSINESHVLVAGNPAQIIKHISCDK